MSAALESLFRRRVRAMTYADLDEIMAIEERAYPFPWSKIIFRDCIRVGYSCWLLETPVRIEAYGVMSIAAGESHVLNLCVRSESQGRGYARRMLAHLLEQARAGNARTIFLEVRPSNGRAVDLYRRAGFCEVGIRPDYYPHGDGREDALVMAKAW